MLNLSRKNLHRVCGAIWLIGGIMLLRLGTTLLIQSVHSQHTLINWSFDGLVFITAIAIGAGYIKGRYLLKKTAMKNMRRLKKFEEKISIFKAYSPKFIVLVCLMVGLGAILRLMQTPSDLRGAVDIAIGTALIRGSLYYFRDLPEDDQEISENEQDIPEIE